MFSGNDWTACCLTGWRLEFLKLGNMVVLWGEWQWKKSLKKLI